jgi:glutaredoxin
MTSPATDLNPARITMYGAAWCGDCRRSKAVLDGRGVDYDYVDLEVEFDGAARAQAISGRTSIPVVVFPDGTHFTEPTDAELGAKLDEFAAATEPERAEADAA